MELPIWLRLYFLFVLAQALLVGSAIIQPLWIRVVLPWDASPLNARFIAALYLMGAISALLCMIAARYADVRISLIEIGFVTGVLLVITIPHFGQFTPQSFPYRWVLFYTIDPLLSALIWWRLRGSEPPQHGKNPLAPLFLTYAAMLGVAGVILLGLPALAARLWPWALPPILGQVYSVFFLTFALGGVLAARDARWAGVRVYVLANLGMLLLILGVSFWHADRFKPGPATWAWYAFCLAGVTGFSMALLRWTRRRLAQGAIA
jgi:hypothetical protein